MVEHGEQELSEHFEATIARQGRIEPRELAVVDIDHALLEYLDAVEGLHFADLRLGLPDALKDRFDLVLTDPPYSPEGIGLFAARAGAAGEAASPREANDPGLDRILRAAVRYDLPVNILCWGNLELGAALMDRHPDTRFIVDHLGIRQPSVPPARRQVRSKARCQSARTGPVISTTRSRHGCPGGPAIPNSSVRPTPPTNAVTPSISSNLR